jgi:hypothetical protein
VVHVVGGEVEGPALSPSISLRINKVEGETVHGQIPGFPSAFGRRDGGIPPGCRGLDH